MSPQRISFWLLLPLFTGFAVCGVGLLYPSLHARYLLHQLNEIELNRSTFEDAKRYAERIGAHEVPYVKCSPAECRWYKPVNNALIPRWYRGKGVSFAIFVTVKDSVVTDKAVEYEIGADPGTVGEAYVGRPAVYVSETESWFKWQRETQRQRQERSHEKPTDYVELPISKGWDKIWYDKDGKIAVDRFAVYISPKSKSIPEDWKQYTAFSYSCFWKYRGCSYAKDLLPIADPTLRTPPPDLLWYILLTAKLLLSRNFSKTGLTETAIQLPKIRLCRR